MLRPEFPSTYACQVQEQLQEDKRAPPGLSELSSGGWRHPAPGAAPCLVGCSLPPCTGYRPDLRPLFLPSPKASFVFLSILGRVSWAQDPVTAHMAVQGEGITSLALRSADHVYPLAAQRHVPAALPRAGSRSWHVGCQGEPYKVGQVWLQDTAGHCCEFHQRVLLLSRALVG